MRRAVIFDLDGTLTVPILNFDVIRAEIGIATGPVLEAMENMDVRRRAEAEAILEAHERRAAQNSTLQNGAAETVAELRVLGFAVGVLTRNARRWTELILSRHDLVVDGFRSREDGSVKPEPGGVLSLCRQFNAAPGSSWMVGDYVFDIQAGNRAGLKTVLMAGDRPEPDFADQADHVIHSLPELIGLVSSGLQS